MFGSTAMVRAAAAVVVVGCMRGGCEGAAEFGLCGGDEWLGGVVMGWARRGGARGWCDDGVAGGDGVADDGLGGSGESGFRV